jgi:hypothetical protein
VAKPQSTLEQIGLTRGKAALIGVLGVALVGVMYLQYGSSDSDEGASPAVRPPGARFLPRSARAAASPPTAAQQPADSGSQSALEEFDQDRWHAPALAEVIAYDPFAVPSAFPQPPRAVVDPRLASDSDTSDAALKARQLAEAVEQMQRQLAELQQRGVHVIVNLRDQYVAMVGERMLHVGDEINGFVVTAIDPDGVRVELKGAE